MKKGKLKSGNDETITKVTRGGGLARSSEEVSVMEMERRG